VLESAIANAEHNHGADIDELKVKPSIGRRGADVEALPGTRQGRGIRASSSATATSPLRVADE
jgi:large subunit ribosomal protein L22